jgi:hypothetical protein
MLDFAEDSKLPAITGSGFVIIDKKFIYFVCSKLAKFES